MHHGQNRGKQNKRQLRKKRKLNDNEENLEILMNLGELTNFVKTEEKCNMHYWFKWKWTPLLRWINEQSVPCMKYIYSPPLKAYTHARTRAHTHTHTPTLKHTQTNKHKHTNAYTYVYVITHALAHARTQAHTHAHARAHKHTHTRTCLIICFPLVGSQCIHVVYTSYYLLIA